MSQPQPISKFAWLRPTVADAVFLIAAVGILQTMQGRNLDDPGLGWHVRNIDAMIEHGGWLDLDPFSSTRGDHAWYTNQWLGDLPLWLGWRWAGLNGIAAVAVIFLGFTYRYLYRILAEDGVPWPAAVVWTFVGLMGSYFAWVVRPNMVNPLFLLITARFCEQFHDGKKSPRQMLWLLPLFAAWANIHGGFLSGLLTLAAVLAIEAAIGLASFEEESRQAARQRLRFLAPLTAGAFLATLVNPYGWKLYPWVINLVTSDLAFLDEWGSPIFNGALWKGAFRYEVLVLLFPALLAVTQRRPNLVALGLAILWLHFALQTRRFLPLWVMVVTPILARASVEIPWLQEALGKIKLSDDLRALLNRPSRPAWPLASIVIALGLLVWAKASGPYASHAQDNLPEAALLKLLDLNDGKSVILNDANWGGYLIWHGWDQQPHFKTWVDDRYEVHGPDHFAEYFALRDAHLGWQDMLAKYRIDVVGLASNWPLAQKLREEPGWEVIHADEQAVILRRRQ